MLTAFAQGKGRRTKTDVAAGTSIRRVLSASEDMLTAAVFERFAYLSDFTFWTIVQRTFRLPRHVDAEDAKLLHLEFWPMLTAGKGTLGQSVEPDLTARFAFPTGGSLALIIECKLDAQQIPGQWAQEWAAWHAEERTEPEEPTYLLALGGLPFSPTETVERFCAELSKTSGLQLTAAAADWSDLLAAVDSISPCNGSEARVLNDVREALRLFGFRSYRDLRELATMIEERRIEECSMTALGRLE